MQGPPADAAGDRLSGLLGYHTTQMLFVAAALGVADQLAAGPLLVDALAARVGAHAPSLHRLLRALASLGVFAEERPGEYRLTAAAERLRADAPDSLRPLILTYGQPWWWLPWGRLLDSVRTGRPAFEQVHGAPWFEYLSAHPEAHRLFDDNMRAMTLEEAGAVVAAHDFTRARTIVDIGAGTGSLSFAILRSRPGVRAVLVDLPAVLERARAAADEAGLAGRITLAAGSFFDSLPGGGDTYLLKDVIHDWEDDRARAILRNCRRAMPASATLLVIERVIPPGNAPSPGKLIDVSMLVLTGGRERTEVEYRALFDSAGLDLVQTEDTGIGIGVMVLRPT